MIHSKGGISAKGLQRLPLKSVDGIWSIWS